MWEMKKFQKNCCDFVCSPCCSLSHFLMFFSTFFIFFAFAFLFYSSLPLFLLLSSFLSLRWPLYWALLRSCFSRLLFSSFFFQFTYLSSFLRFSLLFSVPFSELIISFRLSLSSILRRSSIFDFWGIQKTYGFDSRKKAEEEQNCDPRKTGMNAERNARTNFYTSPPLPPIAYTYLSFLHSPHYCLGLPVKKIDIRNGRCVDIFKLTKHLQISIETMPLITL